MIVFYDKLTRTFSAFEETLVRKCFNGTKLMSSASVGERYRIAQYDPRVRVRYIVRDYNTFYLSNKNYIKSSTKNTILFVQLFASEFMAAFNSVLKDIEGGSQLNTLLGLSATAPEVAKISRNLSISYRRALSSAGSVGAPSSSSYKVLKKDYNEFFTALFKEVFPGLEVDMDKVNLKVPI